MSTVDKRSVTKTLSVQSSQSQLRDRLLMFAGPISTVSFPPVAGKLHGALAHECIPLNLRKNTRCRNTGYALVRSFTRHNAYRELGVTKIKYSIEDQHTWRHPRFTSSAKSNIYTLTQCRRQSMPINKVSIDTCCCRPSPIFNQLSESDSILRPGCLRVTHSSGCSRSIRSNHDKANINWTR